MADRESTRVDRAEEKEATVAKYWAYSNEKLRVRRRAHMVCWLIAMPFAYLAWTIHLHGPVWSMLETSSYPPITETLARINASLIVFVVVMFLLFPLRNHLMDRWDVDPERYGLGESGR